MNIRPTRSHPEVLSASFRKVLVWFMILALVGYASEQYFHGIGSNQLPLLLHSTSSSSLKDEAKKASQDASSPINVSSGSLSVVVDVQVTLTRHKKSLVYYGNKETNTGWYVDTICLQNKSDVIVYGVGAGENIDWDTALIDKYNASVCLFDPTEKSLRYTAPILEYYKTHCGERRSCLTHTPEGLSDHKGKLTFALPANPDHVSMRISALADHDMTRPATVDVNTLQNWMNERGHQYLDILKIDIEGSEYPVLEALLKNDFLPFTQLLVEYHHRFLSDAGKSRHYDVIKGLKKAGFVELWSANSGQEVGYIKVADFAYCEDGKSLRRPFSI